MTYLSPDYKKYIASDKWKMKCAQAYAKYGRKCQACGARDKLHVHHMSYDNFKRESLSDLAVLCHTCHREVHSRHRRGGRQTSLRLVTLAYIKEKRTRRQ